MKIADFGKIVKEDRVLLEYNREITLRNFYNRLVTKLANYYPEFRGLYGQVKTGRLTPEDERKLNDAMNHVLGVAELSDPFKGKYVPFLLTAYTNDALHSIEDIQSNGAEFLSYYKDLVTHRRVPDNLKDLNSIFKPLPKIKSPTDGLLAASQAKRLWSEAALQVRNAVEAMEQEKADKAEGEEAAKGDADTIYENAQVTIVKLNDEKAACYYGRGTQWCTASTRSMNMFNAYAKEGPLFAFLPKKPEHPTEKYQLWYTVDTIPDQYRMQFMDETDDPVEDAWEVISRLGMNEDTFFKLFPGLAVMSVARDAQMVAKIKKSLEQIAAELLPEFVNEAEQDNWSNYVEWLRYSEEEYGEENFDENGDILDSAPDYWEYDTELKNEFVDATHHIKNFNFVRAEAAWMADGGNEDGEMFAMPINISDLIDWWLENTGEREGNVLMERLAEKFRADIVWDIHTNKFEDVKAERERRMRGL